MNLNKLIILIFLIFLPFNVYGAALLDELGWGTRYTTECEGYPNFTIDDPLGICYDHPTWDVNHPEWICLENWFDIESCRGWRGINQKSLYLLKEDTTYHRFIDDPNPTFWFNLKSKETTSNVYLQFVLGHAADLTNNNNIDIKVILTVTPSGTRYRDVTFTIGESGLLFDYDIGESITALGTYGTEKTYYWYVQEYDMDTEALVGAAVTSGEGSNKAACSKAFTTPAYFTSDTISKYYKLINHVTTSSAIISVNTPYTLQTFSIDYGTSSNLAGHSNSIGDSLTGVIKTTLTGLLPNTKYYYAINWKDPTGTTVHQHSDVSPDMEIRSFKTAPNTGTSFKFVVTTDLHLSSSVDSSTTGSFQKEMTAWRGLLSGKDYSFWVDLGDTIDPEMVIARNQDQMDGTYELAFQSFAIGTSGLLPLYMAQGNHEEINQYIGKLSPTTPAADVNVFIDDPSIFVPSSMSWYLPHYRTTSSALGLPAVSKLKYLYNPDHGLSVIPDAKTFYSFEYGDALFVVLDPYLYVTDDMIDSDTSCLNIRPTNLKLGTEQQNWFKNLIAINTKNFIFIMMHQHGGWTKSGGYSHGAFDDGVYGSVLDWISSITYNKNVWLLLGHDHVYGYNTYKGLNVVSCGEFSYETNWDISYLFRNTNWLYETHFEATIATDSGNTITYNTDTGEANIAVNSVLWNKSKNTNAMISTINTETNTMVLTAYSCGTAADVLGWEVGDVIRKVSPKEVYQEFTVDPNKVSVKVFDDAGVAATNPSGDTSEFYLDFSVTSKVKLGTK